MSRVPTSPLPRLVLAIALAALFAGCVEVTPIRSPRTFHSNAYAGYTIDVPRTIDAGATIAYQVETTDVDPFAESDLVLEQPCKVIDHSLDIGLEKLSTAHGLQASPVR